MNIDREPAAACRLQRRIARGLIALGLAGATTIGLATPAFADDSGAADGPTQGQITREQAEREFAAAYEEALRRLEAGDCATYLATKTPGASAERPADVLRHVKEAGRLEDRYLSFHEDDPAAYASSAQGAGSDGSITLYRRSHAETHDPAEYNNVAQLDPVQFRALIIIHEVAHLQGYRHDGRTIEEAVSAILSFDESIVRKCFPETVLPGRATGLRGPVRLRPAAAQPLRSNGRGPASSGVRALHPRRRG